MTSTELIEYQDGDTLLEGFLAKPDSAAKGTVVIVHDWSGRNPFANHKAEQLAKEGYNGFALDMYGKGKLGTTKEEKSALMSPLAENRDLLLQRVTAGFEAAKKSTNASNDKIVIMGFCFGGLCALDLARSGVNIAGAVSFHGLLSHPEKQWSDTIAAKVLVLHGYADPMVPPEQVSNFCNEMTNKKADWQLNAYGNVLHAFTNPEANDPGFGTVYNPQADCRSWGALQQFLRELWG